MLLLWNENTAYWIVLDLVYAFVGIGVGFAGTLVSHRPPARCESPASAWPPGPPISNATSAVPSCSRSSAASLAAGYASAMAAATAAAPDAQAISNGVEAQLQKSFASAEAVAAQHPQYSSQITAAAKDSFLDGADWAYTAGIVAILLGAAVVFFRFPRKDEEERLLTEYHALDASPAGDRATQSPAPAASWIARPATPHSSSARYALHASSAPGRGTAPMSTPDQVAVAPVPAATPVGIDRPSPVARDEHVTRAELAARGKAARREVPRSAHAKWEPASQRGDPVDLLEEQAQRRDPELVPIRYGRMLASPFAFFRGGAYLMASDLAGRPHTGLRAQLCGDAHLSNFGYFAAPDRRLVFSVSDFDETLRGPGSSGTSSASSQAWLWRDETRGFAPAERRSVLIAAVRAYRDAMREFARMRKLDVWYARMDVEALRARFKAEATSSHRKQFERHVTRAGAKDSLRAFAKLTTMVDGTPRIVSDPPLVVPIEEVQGQVQADGLETWIQGVIRSYRRTLSGASRRRLMEGFRYVHAARKVGSASAAWESLGGLC